MQNFYNCKDEELGISDISSPISQCFDQSDDSCDEVDINDEFMICPSIADERVVVAAPQTCMINIALNKKSQVNGNNIKNRKIMSRRDHTHDLRNYINNED